MEKLTYLVLLGLCIALGQPTPVLGMESLSSSKFWAVCGSALAVAAGGAYFWHWYTKSGVDPKTESLFSKDNETKPFTEEELQQAYDALATEKRAARVPKKSLLKSEAYQKKLLVFAQRFMRYMVVRDIKKGKKEYVQALGLKLNKDGYITMEYEPLNYKAALAQNRYLFALSVDEQNVTAADELVELQNKRINQACNKASDNFFPSVEIVDDLDLAAGYLTYKKHIKIGSGITMAKFCSYLAHEFTHHLQLITGWEMGGIYDRSLHRKYRKPADNYVAEEFFTELDADRRAVNMHPRLTDFLDSYAGHLSLPASGVEIGNEWYTDFPYYSALKFSVAAVEKMKKRGQDKQLAETKVMQKSGAAIENFIKGHGERLMSEDADLNRIIKLRLIWAAWAKKNQIEPALRINERSKNIIKGLNENQSKMYEWIAADTADLREKVLAMYPLREQTSELKERIALTANAPYGSDTFFALRKKFGVLPGCEANRPDKRLVLLALLLRAGATPQGGAGL
ncbi:MAG: hypothetical protein M1549_03040 [Candidatus Dependentiae bacterium]|nr:hypothetical protein [Candidatus Dependentiae bacterium]